MKSGVLVPLIPPGCADTDADNAFCQHLVLFQSFLTDNFKVRSVSHGNFHAYEIPVPQVVNIPISTSDSELTTPNGNLKYNSSKQDAPEASSPSVSETVPRMGSTVHETNKKTVTNYSAMHIKPTNPEAAASSALEGESGETPSETHGHKPPNGTPGSYPGNPQRVK